MVPRLALFGFVVLLIVRAAAGDAVSTFELAIRMNKVEVEGEDVYMETSIELPDKAAHIVRFEPQAEMSVVHHMLLYLCTGGAAIPTHQNVGSVGMHSKCRGTQMLIYGWGRNAPGLVLPDGVGYRVGGSSGFTHAVLEVHYLKAKGAVGGGDSSGVVMHLTHEQLPFEAGILMFATGFTIPARDPNYFVQMDCCYDGPEALTAVSFRVHTHTRGRLVWLDELSRGNATRVLQRSPLLPQAFNMVSLQGSASNPGPEGSEGDHYANEPLPGPLVIRPGTHLQAVCRFNASESPTDIYAGPTHAHEMCNLYLQYYATVPVSMSCYAKGAQMNYDLGPAPLEFRGSRLQLSSSAEGFAPDIPDMGQVGGAGFAPDGRSLYVFHRGPRPWGPSSLRPGTDYQVSDPSAIGAPVMAEIDVGSGAALRAWGAGLFNCPHGVSTDQWGNVWVADVGYHQVMKFSAEGKLLLTVGKKNDSGHDKEHFCAPTHVEVASDGSFFVADGYCNSRVVAFTKEGAYAGEWAPPPEQERMFVVHSLALDECRGLLYVADREKGRVFALSGIELSSQPMGWKVHREWNLAPHGAVYDIARVSGGSVFALTWAQPPPQAQALGALSGAMAAAIGASVAPNTGKVSLVRLHPDVAAAPAPGSEEAWELPAEVSHPHALAVHPGPAGKGLVVVVGETRVPPERSRLHRFQLGTVEACRWSGDCPEQGASLPVRPFGHTTRSWKKMAFMTGGSDAHHMDHAHSAGRKLAAREGQQRRA